MMAVDGHSITLACRVLAVSESGFHAQRHRPPRPGRCATPRWPISSAVSSSTAAARMPGDVVSVHWSWACDRLDDRRLANLSSWTRHQLELANQTI